MLSDVELLENKNNYIELLKSTNRENIDKVIDMLKASDFFEAPASTKYHDNFKGGLCYHSLKVYGNLVKLDKEYNLQFDKNSMIIMGLLHDICKINCYVKDKKNVKVGGNWITVDYWSFKDEYPIGHGQKSVIMLLEKGFNLTDLELKSIIGHMNGYDKSDMFDASNIFNLDSKTIWLHVADFIASYNERSHYEY